MYFTRQFKLIVALFVFGLLIPGCPATKPSGGTVVKKDNSLTISAIEELDGKWKTSPGGSIVELDLRGTSADDAALQLVTELPELRSLLLSDTAVTDAGLDLVANVKKLRSLDLRGCDVSNAGIEKLTGLTELRAIKFSGKSGKTAHIDNDVLASISKLTKLKVLAMDSLKFTCNAEGLQQLEGLKELEELYIGNTLVDDEALEVIAVSFPALKKLRTSAAQISDLGMVQFTKMPNLQELDLSENSQIFDGGLAHLAAVSGLKKLNLWRVQITDEGVSHLAGLTNLEWLNLDNITYLSDEGLVHLSGMTKMKFLHLGSTAITDEGLVHLEPLTDMDDLKVTRTGVTEEGAAKLGKKLPKTKIQLEYEGT